MNGAGLLVIRGPQCVKREWSIVTTYYLAVDIGASSGRHILGWMEDGRMRLEEIYRFSNGMVKKDGELCWETDRLFAEILAGMKKCKELGKIPVSMGVDTWGVDFVLLDQEGKMLGNAVGYRDRRNIGMDEKVYEKISPEELYARTGIQKAVFNTIYQLMAVKEQHPEYMEAADCLLFMAGLFPLSSHREKGERVYGGHHRPAGEPGDQGLDEELIGRLGYNRKMFQKLVTPGTNLGGLTEAVKKEVGFDLNVVVPATHDTGSAVPGGACQR